MKCAADACERAAVARGLCQVHYARRRRSDPSFGVIREQGAALRFLRFLPQTDECIEWPFGRFSTGYGHVWLDGKSRTGQVASYLINVGAIPTGMEVCHNCGNRPCVNPRHLRVDTHAANMADCVMHGTDTRGVRNGRARLSEADVRQIRERVAAGELQKDAAESLGATRAMVSNIIRGKTWRSLT